MYLPTKGLILLCAVILHVSIYSAVYYKVYKQIFR